MKIQNKTEIDLSEDDVKNILYEYLRKEYGGGEYSFRFKVANKMIPGPDPHDGYDNYVFDSIKVIINNV